LKKVTRPDGKEVGFEYDALGRRTAKVYGGTITRWVWDGNTPLHEWKYKVKERPKIMVDEFGDVSKDKSEPVNDLISWLFDEGTFKPAAKLKDGAMQSIITDYLGTPVEMYDDNGKQTWGVEYDVYGKIRKRSVGGAVDCPFRYQGQYEDEETGLYYNRFRYYDSKDGNYISQDPTGITSNNPTLYGYVKDTNSFIDLLGLDEILTSGTVYRGGSGTLNNLTPAPKDASGPKRGLSTYTAKPESGKFQTIDVAKLEGTGLEAVKNGDNHVSIRPANDPNDVKLKEWSEAKGKEGVEHPFSKAVKKACV
jgi:RHS repeat-associated protein